MPQLTDQGVRANSTIAPTKDADPLHPTLNERSPSNAALRDAHLDMLQSKTPVLLVQRPEELGVDGRHILRLLKTPEMLDVILLSTPSTSASRADRERQDTVRAHAVHGIGEVIATSGPDIRLRNSMLSYVASSQRAMPLEILKAAVEATNRTLMPTGPRNEIDTRLLENGIKVLQRGYREGDLDTKNIAYDALDRLGQAPTFSERLARGKKDAAEMLHEAGETAKSSYKKYAEPIVREGQKLYSDNVAPAKAAVSKEASTLYDRYGAPVVNPVKNAVATPTMEKRGMFHDDEALYVKGAGFDPETMKSLPQKK